MADFSAITQVKSRTAPNEKKESRYSYLNNRLHLQFQDIFKNPPIILCPRPIREEKCFIFINDHKFEL